MPVRYRARKCTRERKAKINKKNRAANLAKARKYLPTLKKKYAIYEILFVKLNLEVLTAKNYY